MDRKHLATYLNDHLSGSVTVLEMLGHLASAYSGTELQQFALQSHAEVLEDRRELEGLMGRLNIGQSAARKTSAWVAEKMAQLKLRVDDPAAGALRLLESTEAISLGVEGKRLLWHALATETAADSELATLGYARLIERAEDQRRRLEKVRLEAASALVGDHALKA